MYGNVNYEGLPNQLKRKAQWVMWKYATKNNKPTKIPYQLTGELAKTNNRRSWATFATAWNALKTNTFDGIGFVFSKDDTFIGIDIDNCVNDGVPNEFANTIIELLDSYTEFSPSGKGIHIIVKGNLPNSIKGTGKKSTEFGLEVYSYGRYFTMTGNRENENDVLERTDELAELFQFYFPNLKQQEEINNSNDSKPVFSNEELWSKMFESKKGKEILALYEGELLNNDWSVSDLTLTNHLAFWTARNTYQIDSMMRETALMRDKWDKIHHSTGETYGEHTIAISIASTVEVYNGKPKKFMLSELGNAERIVEQYKSDISYVPGADWYIWDGKRWCEDKNREIELITNKVLRGLFNSSDEYERKWAKICEKRSIRMNTIKDMIPLVPAKLEEFNTNKYLFNVENGVVDLKTGALLSHNRKYKITKISKIKYDINAKSDVWEEFLNTIFEDDLELIEYIQRLVGYSLTGNTSEQIIIFLIGNGRNGKSTFINTIQTMMGDYAKQTNSETFIKKKYESAINNDIARLVDTRFVSAIESEDGQQLSESLVKQLTGGEKISARFLQKEFFEFEPEFKIFFTTNHKPIIKGHDEGIWRRIKLIPFNKTIQSHEIDKTLVDKLKSEIPGILNWAITGCKKWLQFGLNEPLSVKNATEKYKEEMDIIKPFIDEECYVNPLAKIEAKKLYLAYEKYCFHSGEMAMKNRTFYRTMEAVGYKKEKGNGNKNYLIGICLQRDRAFVKKIENDSLPKFKLQ